MTTNENTTHRWNMAGMRTLHALEKTLHRHAHELMQIDCEDVEAAEAIVFAIEAVEKAIENARTTVRRMKTEA